MHMYSQKVNRKFLLCTFIFGGHFHKFLKMPKRKPDEEVSKELQEIRRSTRKLAKFIPGLDTSTAAQTTGETTEPQQAE